MITRKQQELLRFIQGRVQESGVPPSFDEMRMALDLHSKSGIHRMISALEERGFIRRLHNRARAIEVIKQAPGRGFGQEAPQARGDESTAVPSPSKATHVSIPLMGRIAAGTPIAAIQRHNQTISLPGDMMGQGEHYALDVVGDSMMDAGILHGDVVVIRRQETAINGDIVVALIDGEEATLKRFRKVGTSIALEPANPNYVARVLGPERVKIQGRLVNLMRRY